MASKPKTDTRPGSGLTRPGDLYVPGDALPAPDVVEKDSDSVWALWSEAVNESEEQDEAKEKDRQPDFKETVPLDLESLEPTTLMPLPDLPKGNDN